VGIDRGAAAIVRDKARAESQGISNVQFLEADPTLIRLDDGFDAIVSRLILMYYPDPIEAQRIRDEVLAEDAVVVVPLLIGAWVRHPG
jgi:ubiquinone/menaquinone biosynthesis C-methylase UbiE